MGKGKARTRMYGANKNASTSPTKEAVHTGAKFYDYYDMLSLPMPHAPFCAPDPHRRPDTDPNEHLYSPQAVKKGYRRASLIHHPDRGGDPDVFIKLKRAAKVLGDKVSCCYLFEDLLFFSTPSHNFFASSRVFASVTITWGSTLVVMMAARQSEISRPKTTKMRLTTHLNLTAHRPPSYSPSTRHCLLISSTQHSRLPYYWFVSRLLK